MDPRAHAPAPPRTRALTTPKHHLQLFVPLCIGLAALMATLALLGHAGVSLTALVVVAIGVFGAGLELIGSGATAGSPLRDSDRYGPLLRTLL